MLGVPGARSAGPRRGGSARPATVEDRLFRWLAVLRLVVLVNAVALNVYRRDNFVHPVWRRGLPAS